MGEQDTDKDTNKTNQETTIAKVTQHPDGTRETIIQSGFYGAKIIVTEDLNYNITARYL